MKAILAAVAAAATIATAAASWAETVTMKYSSWLPDQHHVNQRVMYPWFAEIEKVTEGRVKVEVLPKMVGTALSQFDVVRDGLADVSFIVAGYTPGRFPLAEMAELSFLGNDARIFAPIFNRYYREHMEPLNEFEGVELMTIMSNAPGNVLTLKKPVRSIEDFKGLKLRSTGPYTTALLNAVGAIPILKSSAETFEMLTAGTIDGSLAQRETAKNMNMIDLMGHATLVPGGLFSSALAVIVNPSTWAKISAEDREAINAVSHEALALSMGTSFYIADADSEETMRATPTLKVETASDAFVAELKEVVKPLEADWAERAKAKGLADPLAVLAAFRAEVTAAEQAAK
ncbi:TRAP transporter substrate-binding protein [Ruixingdingia sedimenti]|uniref:TRAP transporter substrate-binding protein n=1 Tax=Ruixingdingia sedimenti TaxID=3073604 RepID=A0ABU1F2U5_9RHOB|nr:TRAP transporter substrate-binding protein [Xinfangfangia sp. LG-4]MDR5651187.1 TRAP transporter substrate-binding protein [Xinfangfangia sp. LG-4]